MNAEKIASQIRKTYGATATQRNTDWMTMETVLDHLDATVEQIRDGVLWLMANDRQFFATEETNQKALSPIARKYRVIIGGSPVDVMRWQ
jgi:hypothetical protein